MGGRYVVIAEIEKNKQSMTLREEITREFEKETPEKEAINPSKATYMVSDISQ